MNRRGFLGSLFAGAAAPFLPKPAALLPPGLVALAPLPALSPEMEEFERRYMESALKAWVDRVDTQVLAYQHRITLADLAGLDPARLPL